MSTRLFLILLVAALAGCAAPVGIERIDPTDAQRDFAAFYLNTGRLSESANSLLDRLDLDEAWREDPGSVLVSLHERLVSPTDEYSMELRAGFLAELAELAYAHASESGDARYYLVASIYAWSYVFPPPGQPPPGPLARGIRRSADIYNRAIALALTDPDSGDVVPRGGSFELPFGQLEVELDDDALRWGDHDLSRFVTLSDLEVRGIRNRIRHSGLGAPLAAQSSSRVDEASGEDAPDLVFSGLWTQVTALLEFQALGESLPTGNLRARLRLMPYSDAAFVEIQDRTIALESEPTAALALALTETPPWRRELRGLFQGDLALGNVGLTALAPYHPGRIPIVFVHGTASSSGRWADLVNALQTDPVLRQRFQLWFFTYNTGNPIVYSGYLLREAIRELVDSLDPEGRDPALRDLVVIGHSQGGLLTKLQAVDAGERFWDAVLDRPPDEIELEPASRQLLEGSLLVRPSPYVRRVIFLATPHRGSRLANRGAAILLGRMIRAPANVVSAIGDAYSDDPDDEVQRRLRRSRGSIGNMSPENDFIQILADLPIAEGIHAHSIIGVRGEPTEEGGDGVVRYESAHLEDVDSELVIESGHSSQSHPRVALEVRRILLEHLDDAIVDGIVEPVEPTLAAP